MKPKKKTQRVPAGYQYARDEHGATPKQVDAAEKRALQQLVKDRKADRLVEFTGKLPVAPVPLATFPQSALSRNRHKLEAALARHGFAGIEQDGRLACYVVSATVWNGKNFDSDDIVRVTKRGVPVFYVVPVFLWNALLCMLESFTPAGLRRSRKLLAVERPHEAVSILPAAVRIADSRTALWDEFGPSPTMTKPGKTQTGKRRRK